MTQLGKQQKEVMQKRFTGKLHVDYSYLENKNKQLEDNDRNRNMNEKVDEFSLNVGKSIKPLGSYMCLFLCEVVRQWGIEDWTLERRIEIHL